ncbi:hypothetical protein HYU21_04655 [Candidatus Woesearchaeota archaeon]|nr:hypothetical protein [Candidatus Woesearchaeota archaeon]
MDQTTNKSPGTILSAYYYTLSDITSIGMLFADLRYSINSQILDHNLAQQSIDAVYLAYEALDHGKYKRAKKQLLYSLEQARTYREELSTLLDDKIKSRFLERTAPALQGLIQLLKEPADNTWLHLNQVGISSFADLALIRFNGY